MIGVTTTSEVREFSRLGVTTTSEGRELPGYRLHSRLGCVGGALGGALGGSLASVGGCGRGARGARGFQLVAVWAVSGAVGGRPRDLMRGVLH